MITELYYGTIKMVVEKQFSAELDAQLKNNELEALTRIEGSYMRWNTSFHTTTYPLPCGLSESGPSMVDQDRHLPDSPYPDETDQFRDLHPTSSCSPCGVKRYMDGPGPQVQGRYDI